jgi:hypothetical protein
MRVQHLGFQERSRDPAMGSSHHNTPSVKMARLVAAVLAAGLGSAGVANAAVLTFDAAEACMGGCINSSLISQSYGDTPLVDVAFDGDVNNLGLESMRFWAGGYSDLIGVAYFGLAFPSPKPAGVYLTPISGYEITLNSFDLGSFGGAHTTQLTLRGGDGSLISSTGFFLSNGAARNAFTPGLTRADGFRIEFGPDNFNIGIDNINYTVSQIGVVPEPATWALVILGVGAVGGMMRRHRRVRLV